MSLTMIEELIIIAFCIVLIFINPVYMVAIFWATMSIIVGHSYIEGCNQRNLDYENITLIEVMFTAPVTFFKIAISNVKQDMGLTTEDNTMFDMIIDEDEEDKNDDSKT